VFGAARSDVPRLDADVFVARVRYEDVVLHHYAWASRWFKVNVTTDLAGQVVETLPTDGVPAYTFNIDIATPMLHDDREVFAVDLFADVLVRADGVTYVVGGQDETKWAATAGLISEKELRGAERALGQLVEIVERGSLMTLLYEAWPLEPSNPRFAPAMERVAICQVAVLAPYRRWTW